MVSFVLLIMNCDRTAVESTDIKKKFKFNQNIEEAEKW